MDLVIDVSVAAKWLLPASRETLVEEAEAVLVRYSRNEVRLLVPDLFWSEFGNVLWKAVWQKRFDEQTALRALNQMRDYRLETRAAEPLLDHALALATRFNRSLYDSIYVALAVESKTQLITADERLANAVAAHLPVKWLGAIVH
jgi:predicted nucleic acid-binding protein